MEQKFQIAAINNSGVFTTSNNSKNNTNSSNNNGITQGLFITILLAIVIAWILVSLWTRVIENFVFGTLGLIESSTWHAFLLAISVTIIFIVFVWTIDRLGNNNNIEEEVDRGFSGSIINDPLSISSANPTAFGSLT